MEKILKSGWCIVVRFCFKSLVILGAFIKLISASTLSEPLLNFAYNRPPVEIIEDMSILVKRDALDFYRKTNDKIFGVDANIQSTPYKTFFEVVLFGKTFEIGRFGPDVDYNNVLGKISTENTRKYFQIFCDDSILDEDFSAGELRKFREVFSSVFDNNSENIFSKFVFGFLSFIEGIESLNDIKKNEGFILLKSSADGFCLPASYIVYFEDKKKQERLSEICDQLAQKVSMDIIFEEIILYHVSNKKRLFLECHLYEVFQDRLYKLLDEKEKKYFSEVEKKIADRTLQQYRSTYYNILNKKYLFVFSVSSIAALVGLAVNYESSGQIYLPYMMTSAFIGFCSSIFVLFSNPSFVLMSQDLLKLEKCLCAFYLTYSIFIKKSFEPASLTDELYTNGPFSYSLRKYYLSKIRCKCEETFSQLFLREAKNAASSL